MQFWQKKDWPLLPSFSNSFIVKLVHLKFILSWHMSQQMDIWLDLRGLLQMELGYLNGIVMRIKLEKSAEVRFRLYNKSTK